MVNGNMADILATLAQHIIEITQTESEGIYLYAEADGGSVEAGIFKADGESVAYWDPDDELFETIDQLWQAADSDKKWAVMEYAVTDGRFDADFLYPDQLDPEETSYDRRERALHARYGGKPVIYPPMDDDFHEVSEDELSKD